MGSVNNGEGCLGGGLGVGVRGGQVPFNQIHRGLGEGGPSGLLIINKPPPLATSPYMTVNGNISRPVGYKGIHTL